MILYCDTSALIKLYLREVESDALLAAARSADIVAVCRITWAEAMAGFARRAREVGEDSEAIEQARQRLHTDWLRYAIVEVSQSLVEQAGDLADTFALRGYDSVQLAAALVLKTGTEETVAFACYDKRLRKAAQVLGLQGVAG